MANRSRAGAAISSSILDRRELQIAAAARVFTAAAPFVRSDYPDLAVVELRAVLDCVGASEYVNETTLRTLDEEAAAIGEPGANDGVALSDHSTTVVDRGTGGIPVVLIHSLGLDWRMSQDTLPSLAKSGRVIAYDLRLHGTATEVQPESFTLQACADDLALLLDSLSINRAVIVGFSLGGAVAQTFALKHPSRVAGLGLVCTMAISKGRTYLDRASMAETAGMETQMVPTMERWFNSPELALNGWAVRYARNKVRNVSPVNWAAYWRGLAAVDTLGQLSRVQAETVVIAGGDDRSTPPKDMQAIADAIAGSTFHIVPNAPHMISLVNPQAVTDLLIDFRSKITASHAAS